MQPVLANFKKKKNRVSIEKKWKILNSNPEQIYLFTKSGSVSFEEEMNAY